MSDYFMILKYLNSQSRVEGGGSTKEITWLIFRMSES